MRNFIPILFLCILLLGNNVAFAQLDIGTGVEWGTLSPTEPLVLDEDFQGFEFFHTDQNADQGNSDPMYDGSGGIIYAYKNDTFEVSVINAPELKIKYYCLQCAYAPDWKTSYAYRDDTENTANVSNGFVEISRDFGSDPPTVRGELVVDLRELDFVEVIQWSHSSTGGNKRGVMLQISLDDGATWDTLRYQPGTNWALSFTKDPTTGVKTPNGIRCDPSAYGMTWEDGVYAENVMLKFLEAGGQTPRIHDLKVYAGFTTTSVRDVFDNDLLITQVNRRISVSERANLSVFQTDGRLVKTVLDTDQTYLSDLPAGVYIVRAQAGEKVKAVKAFLN